MKGIGFTTLTLFALVSSTSAASLVAVWQERIGGEFQDSVGRVCVGPDKLPVLTANIGKAFSDDPKRRTSTDEFHGVVVKYNLDGSTRWRLATEGAGSARFFGGAADAENNIHVSAHFNGDIRLAGRQLSPPGESATKTLTISPEGKLLTVEETMIGSVRHVGGAGHFYTYSYSNGQPAVVSKAGRNLKPFWRSQVAEANPAPVKHSETESTESRTTVGITVDQQGNTFAAKAFMSWRFERVAADTFRDLGEEKTRIAIMKLNSKGQGVWRKTFVSDDHGVIGSRVLLDTDPSGNLVVVIAGRRISFNGEVVEVRGGRDVFVAKFDTNGRCLWMRHGGGPGLDDVGGLDTDEEGNVYLAGYSQCHTDIRFGAYRHKSIPDGHAAFVTKLTSAGEFEWLKVLDGMAREYVSGLTCDPDRGVYLTGTFRGFPGGGFETEAGRLEVNPVEPQRFEVAVPGTVGGRGKKTGSGSATVTAASFQMDGFVIAFEERLELKSAR